VKVLPDADITRTSHNRCWGASYLV